MKSLLDKKYEKMDFTQICETLVVEFRRMASGGYSPGDVERTKVALKYALAMDPENPTLQRCKYLINLF